MDSDLNRPIVVEEGEGLDEITQIQDPHQPIDRLKKIDRLVTRPVYASGSSPDVPVADPLIYPDGIMGGANTADKAIYVLSQVEDGLVTANERLKDSDLGLSVVSGFISPRQQQLKWQMIYKRLCKDFFATNKRHPNDEEKVKLAIQADNAGSWADLKTPWTSGHLTRQENLLTKADANAGANNLPLDLETATTVHNLGTSANVILTDAQGRPKNMGVGLDTPNELVQRVDFFEGNNVDAFEDAIARDPGLRRYHQLFGIDVKSHGSIEDTFGGVRDTRRALFNAVSGARFGYYKDEQGHTSGQPIGPWNRQDAYRQMREMRNPALD